MRWKADPGFFIIGNPDLEVVRIGLLNLIDKPVLDFQDQKAVLVPKRTKSGTPALPPDCRLIPGDEIRIRPGRLMEETKGDPFACRSVFKIFDIPYSCSCWKTGPSGKRFPAPFPF